MFPLHFDGFWDFSFFVVTTVSTLHDCNLGCHVVAISWSKHVHFKETNTIILSAFHVDYKELQYSSYSWMVVEKLQETYFLWQDVKNCNMCYRVMMITLPKQVQLKESNTQCLSTFHDDCDKLQCSHYTLMDFEIFHFL